MSLAQAEALGYTRSDVFRRVRGGRLRPVFPHTYRIAGSPPSLEQRAMAAAVWAGKDAVISHETAAALWGIDEPAAPLHVTVRRKPGRPPQGVQTHVTECLPKRDWGRLRGVPVTNVSRTLLDLAGHRNDDDLLPVVERAVLRDLVTPEQVADVLRRNPSRRGCRRLEAVLVTAASSALERRVEAILRGAGLPPHRREYPVGRFRLDFAWPRARVAVETDGRRWHSSAPDFARDRARHNFLVENGWRVLHATRRDLDDPAPLLATLARLLTAVPGPLILGSRANPNRQPGGTQWQSRST